jgi:hypothetical protein
MENISAKRINQCLICAGISLIIFFIAMYMIPCFDGGCALMLLSIFLFFTSLAVAGLVFYPMSRTFGEVTEDTALLAHWVYDPEWFSRIVQREYDMHKERNAALLIIIDGMLLFFALFFIIFVPEGGVETGIILLGVATVIYIVAKVTPGFFRDRKSGKLPEAWISQNGLIYLESVYPYSGFMYGCTGVSYQEGREPALVFQFYQITGARIYDPFEITVPVPKGEEEKAKKIAKTLFL